MEAAIEHRLDDRSEAVRLRALEILGRNREGPTLERLRQVAQTGSAEFVVEAIRVGAHDFVTKPFDVQTIRNTVARALQSSSLQRQVEVRKQSWTSKDFKELSVEVPRFK